MTASDLDHLAISRILGSTIQPFSRSGFGGFSAVRAVGEMLAARPRPPGRLAPDDDRDEKIRDAFRRVHKGFAVDRLLADPDLVREFIAQARSLGVDATGALINRRLLRLRKAGNLGVETTAPDEARDLNAFLIPAELAFAQLTYRYEVTYDDLLADPEVGSVFDTLALRFGRGGSAVDYRLAALHLRKNVRSRSTDERKKLAHLGATELTRRWRPLGPVARIAAVEVPSGSGIFALAEPNRYLYLTRYPSIQEGVERFRDPALLAALGNRFWTPSLETISVQVISQDRSAGTSLRLLELKALELYRPIFNLLPNAA